MLYNIYKDHPNKCFKATVANKRRFVCNWDETKLDDPARLQDIVECFTQDKQDGRAFIRPSGTEDVLRIYVEAKHEKDVDAIGDILLEEIATRFENYGEESKGACNVLCLN